MFVAGRINQPQDAEKVIASGQADMVRHDPRDDLRSGDGGQGAKPAQLDDIRACIACNQACIGHFHLGLSDLLHPASGDRAAS